MNWEKVFFVKKRSKFTKKCYLLENNEHNKKLVLVELLPNDEEIGNLEEISFEHRARIIGSRLYIGNTSYQIKTTKLVIRNQSQIFISSNIPMKLCRVIDILNLRETSRGVEIGVKSNNSDNRIQWINPKNIIIKSL